MEAALGGGFDEDNGAAHEDSFLCGARGWPESSDTGLPHPGPMATGLWVESALFGLSPWGQYIPP